MKKGESKAELRERISYLQKQNDKLIAQLEEEQRIRWRSKTGPAIENLVKTLSNSFGYGVKDLRLDHIDKVGYWFQFNLVNDSTVQTYCVRHDEI